MLKVFLKIKKKLKENGFTLVELLAVIVILGIILIITIPTILNVMGSAKKKSFEVYANKSIKSANEKYFQGVMTGSPYSECIVYNIKNDLNIPDTGKYDGYILINLGTNDLYLTLYDEDYYIAGYHYNDNNSKIVDNIKNYNKKAKDQLTPEYLCNKSNGTTCKYFSNGENIIVENETINNEVINEADNSDNNPGDDTPGDVTPGDDLPLEEVTTTTTTTTTTKKVEPVKQSFSTTLIDGRDLNKKFLEAAGLNSSSNINQKSIIKEVRRSSSLNNSAKLINVSLNNTDSQKKPFYIWFQNGIIYFYCDADSIYMNPISESLFDSLPGLTSVNDFFNYVSFVKVTNMFHMFSGCTSLSSLDLSNVYTRNVVNMGGMFTNCSNLTSLNLSKVRTPKVVDMSWMFVNCSKLSSLNLLSFDTSKVTTMHGMFHGCSNLKNVYVSSFNTTRVKDMGNMFAACYSITSLNLSNFSTPNVTDMSGMFTECHSLVSLDITGFNTSNVINMGWMFAGCPVLTTIRVRNFNVSKVSNSTQMFNTCPRLPNYNANFTDKSRAFVGAGGYLSN